MSERNILTAHLELRTGLTSEEKLALSRELWDVLIPHLIPGSAPSMIWRGSNDLVDAVEAAAVGGYVKGGHAEAREHIRTVLGCPVCS